MKRTPLRPMSARRRKEMPARRAAVAALLAERPWCEVQLPGLCAGRAVDGHERLSRARGGDHLHPDVAVCRPCHDHITQNPTWAEDNGWALPSAAPVTPVVAVLPVRRDDDPGHADGPPDPGDPSNASAP
jgi:hypothetical protein